jgi:hypothetical protein
LAGLAHFPRAARGKPTLLPKAEPKETLVKVLVNLAAVSLSIVLGLMPFAVIAVNDVAVAKAGIVATDGFNSGHAFGVEGR